MAGNRKIAYPRRIAVLKDGKAVFSADAGRFGQAHSACSGLVQFLAAQGGPHLDDDRYMEAAQIFAEHGYEVVVTQHIGETRFTGNTRGRALQTNKVHLELSIDQANAICKGLDVYSRLCIGQIEILSDLIREGTIPLCSAGSQVRGLADSATCDNVDKLVDELKGELGYPSNGSHNLGHQHVDPSAHRGYEIGAVLQIALAKLKELNPAMRVKADFEGFAIRYTNDPLPVARLEVQGKTFGVHK